MQPVLHSAKTQAQTVFDVQDISRIYRMGDVDVVALRGARLILREREFVVLFRGQDLATMTEPERTWFRRRSVGIVFQFYNLILCMTAQENVALVTEILQFCIRAMRCVRALELKIADRRFHGRDNVPECWRKRILTARIPAP